jgi:hypothetical protein
MMVNRFIGNLPTIRRTMSVFNYLVHSNSLVRGSQHFYLHFLFTYFTYIIYVATIIQFFFLNFALLNDNVNIIRLLFNVNT